MEYIGDNYYAHIENTLTHDCGELNRIFDISSSSGVSRSSRIPEIEDTVTNISNIFTSEITKTIKLFNSDYFITGTGPYNLVEINGHVHLKDSDSIRYRNNCYFNSHEAFATGNQSSPQMYFRLPVGLLPLEFICPNFLIGEYASGLAIINNTGQILHKFSHYPVRKGMLALNIINNCLEVIDLLNDSVIYSYLIPKGETVAASIKDTNIVVYSSSAKGNTLSIHNVQYTKKTEKCSVCSFEIINKEYVMAPCGCNTFCVPCTGTIESGKKCPACKKMVIRKIFLK